MLANHRGGFFFATIKPFIANLGPEKRVTTHLMYLTHSKHTYKTMRGVSSAPASHLNAAVHTTIMTTRVQMTPAMKTM